MNVRARPTRILVHTLIPADPLPTCGQSTDESCGVAFLPLPLIFRSPFPIDTLRSCFAARDEAQRAKEKACNALEMESEVVQREAAVEVKWEEIMTSRRALKQVIVSRLDVL